MKHPLFDGTALRRAFLDRAFLQRTHYVPCSCDEYRSTFFLVSEPSPEMNVPSTWKTKNAQTTSKKPANACDGDAFDATIQQMTTGKTNSARLSAYVDYGEPAQELAYLHA